MKNNLDELDKVDLLHYLGAIDELAMLTEKQSVDKNIKNYAKAIKVNIEIIEKILEIKNKPK